jgi:hypothetical protein
MSTNDNSQKAKGVVDTRVRDNINNGSNESQTNQKGDEHIILASQQHPQQQQQQPFYQQSTHQQYTMYPSGVTYSIDPNQAGGGGGLDYTMLPTQQIYQFPVYYSSETYHQPQQFEDHYQTSPSAQFPTAQGPSTQYHQLQTAHYSGTPGGEQQQNYMHPENSQVYQKANATMFDNTAAKYTADWVSRTTLIPSEMKVPPELPGEIISHNSRVITPKNWGEGSYVVTTTQSKLPVASITNEQPPPLDQQLAQLDITPYPFLSTQLPQAPHQPGSGGYAFNWAGTSQQQPQQQQQYRDQSTRAYSASAMPKFQSTSFADVLKKNNNNKGPMQQSQPQGGMNFQDQRGTQSAQPTFQPQSQIRYEKSFAGPKNTFNQIGSNNGGGFVRNVNRSSGNFNNRGNMPRPNTNRSGPRPQNPSFSGPPQQRGPLPSLLAQHRTQNFPRSNFGGQRTQGNIGYTSFGGHGQHHQQMPEFNPGVPPPALPNQFRQPMPSMMPPFPPPPPFNMMNPQQQQQFFRAFISQVRPDAMIQQHGPYGFDQYGQRFFNPGFPFGPGPPFGQFNRHPNFNRGQRRGRGSRFQQPRRNYQEQSRFQADRQTSNQDSTDVKPLDPEMADSVNRGPEFDRDETKTPEPKGDTETTGSSNEEKKVEDSSPTSQKSAET